ncbi:MAG: hypothetical protein WAX56_02135, partial [Gemmiger qucibialis]
MLCAVWASAAKAYFFISTFPRYNSQPPHRGTFPQAGRLAAFIFVCLWVQCAVDQHAQVLYG